MNRAVPFGLAFLAVLTAVTIGITQPAIGRAQESVRTTSMLLAKLMSSLFLSVISEDEIELIMREVIAKVDFPMVITDQDGNPRAWKQVNVDPERFTPEELAEPENLRNDPDYRKLLAARDKLKGQNEPFPISTGGGVVLGYVYFGQPGSLGYLRLLQVILPLLGLLTFLGLLWAARSVHSYQAAAFWASFAKGLAHQMGAPVSSSMGWLELLKKEGADPKVTEGLESDLERMRSILRRFSKIGGPPNLEPVLLPKLAESAVAEAQARFLHDMTAVVVYDGQCLVRGDSELLSWVFEIFLKNAWEARRAEGALVRIRVREEERHCVVEIEDNGMGIPKEKQGLLFRRSYSTKERGWGVGLLLVKRIVEDIHRGKVKLILSVPGERTVFAMRLRKWSS